MKRFIVLRGVPGAGKTTYAKRLQTKFLNIYGVSIAICSADNYFIKNGSYIYDRTKLSKAHEYCYDCVRKAMTHGTLYILLDNTNTRRSDFVQYVRMAQQFNYDVVEKIFGLDADISDMAKRNLHGVPESKVELMARTLADSIRNVEGQTIKKANGIMTIRIKR